MRKTEGRHRDSNPEPSDHVSSTLTIAPPRHDRFGRLDSAPKYSVTLAARMRPPTALAINSRPPWRAYALAILDPLLGCPFLKWGTRLSIYAFLKQWWGPPQGLERLPRAGLRQNPHYLYY